jgi:ribosomal protein S12 methylthiotransferase accessory factor
MIDKWRGIVSTGSSAKPDLNEAALKALLEAVQVRELLKSLPPAEKPRFHLQLYQGSSLSEDIRQLFYSDDFFLSNQAQITVSAGKLLEKCKEAGLDVYACNLTTRDLADEGLVVLRVVIPQAVRLFREFELPYLGGERLYRLPEKLGFVCRKKLNIRPHPFG